MIFRTGGHEVRKVQSTGGRTCTVRLKRPRVREQLLEARVSLRGDRRRSAALRITPINMGGAPAKHGAFDADKLPENGLRDHLMGGYISGTDRL